MTRADSRADTKADSTADTKADTRAGGSRNGSGSRADAHALAQSDAAPDTPEPTKLDQMRERYPWLDHLVRAATRYTEKHGDHYAAAITYFSILALVPVIMIAFAAAAFVLAGNQPLLDQLQNSIKTGVPPGLGDTINGVVDQAIKQRNTVGIIGLAGALFTGLGWMGNLREALSEQWDQRGDPPPVLARYGGDLVAMIGLFLAFILSFAITAIGSGLSSTILEFLGLAEQTWAKVLLSLISIVLTLAANWLVFLWVIARLPREPVTLRSAAKAAVLAAIGFVVLQQVMTYYISSVTSSPAGAAFGPIIGLLVFANFVSRFILFVTAWAATMTENMKEDLAEPAPVVVRPSITVGRRPGPRTTAGLLGAGAVLGVLGGGFLGRSRRR